MPGKKIVSAKLDLDEAALQVALGEAGPVGVWVKRVTLKAERYAKQRCPVDTGRLRASITSRIERDSATVFVGVVGTDVEYAPYVEYGARGRAPVGFLRGGVDQALAEERKP